MSVPRMLKMIRRRTYHNNAVTATYQTTVCELLRSIHTAQMQVHAGGQAKQPEEYLIFYLSPHLLKVVVGQGAKNIGRWLVKNPEASVPVVVFKDGHIVILCGKLRPRVDVVCVVHAVVAEIVANGRDEGCAHLERGKCDVTVHQQQVPVWNFPGRVGDLRGGVICAILNYHAK